MEWTQLERHGDDASRAFEALTGQLFERFCRREYGDALREVRFVNGEGGDGGVEAYAILDSGDQVGLQTKWFRDPVGQVQIRQIEKSFRSAMDNHPRLVRFVVAIPRNLGDTRDKLGSGASPTRSREKPERKRWDEWTTKAKTSAPGIAIELWDEAKLESLLSEHENEGLLAYWFTSSTIPQENLKHRCEAAQTGWLHLRYFPSLHASGVLEKELGLRLGTPAARAELLRKVRWAVGELSAVRDDEAHLLILEAWERWERSARIVAFVGPPGIGKTHGLAQSVEARIRDQQPALLLRAKDCLLAEEGWAEILRKALDRPAFRLEMLLNALEALAVRADVRRAHESATPGTGTEIAEVSAEPTCFLLAIDGLEESGRHERWAELLGELATHLTHHPRIRVAVTLRTSSQRAILSRVKSDAFTVVVLPRDGGNVQELLAAYCKQYAVSLPGQRLRWAIRDPLSVRLYCEAVRRASSERDFSRQSLSLTNLLMAKLADIAYVEPAYEPLTDYLLAKIACDAIRTSPACNEQPGLDPVLATRPDALTQAAILLAEEGINLIASGLWKDDLPEDQLEILQLRAIAALDDEMARPYSDWVRSRLLASRPSCRRVLAELCIPVARDEAHPFGPRFVHQTLLPILPAIRDLVWSGPSYSLEDGAQPGEGNGLEALELLKLDPEDSADGPPLLLAWALTSVDQRWRRRLRAELAQWGAGNLDEVVRWLDLAMQTNDPQMAEDVAMAAYGAACLAGADLKLGVLAAWVDANLLAPDASLRREDIVVLHAARGIVERAHFMGANVDPAALEHARRLYSTTADTLPIDAAAAKEANDHWGVRPITGDLAWYVVPRAIKPFFGLEPWERLQRLDVRAERILAMHAAAAQIDELTPQKFAFGVVAAHLNTVGYEAREKLGWPASRSKRYERGSHGERSQICSLVEKYVWTGCFHLQAYLAGRAPAVVSAADGADRMSEPPNDPLLVSYLIPNPASDVRRYAGIGASWSFCSDAGLTPSIDLESRIQADMADEWIRRAPTPDLHPWLRSATNAALSSCADADWVVLFSQVEKTESASQAESHLFISSFSVPRQAAVALRLGGYQLTTSRRWDLSQACEGIRCHIYADPFDAAWAPWVKGSSVPEELQLGHRTRIDVQATVAGLTWQGEKGEALMNLPAHWLRTALSFAGAERRSTPSGEEWRFVDRRGDVHAVLARTFAARDRRETLLVKRSSLRTALASQGKTLVWAAWLHRRPNPSLSSEACEGESRPLERNWEWLAFLTPDGRGEDIVELPPFGAPTGTPSPSTAEPPPAEPRADEPSSLVPVGPTNPGLATRLELDLDDDNAIPYFLWDDPMTVRELREHLSSASPPERDRLLGKVLREARDPDVWRFTTPGEVAARFDALSKHLGRRRAFWKFLMSTWEQEGLLVQKSA